MKRISCLFVFLLFFSSTLLAQKEKDGIESAVIGFFNGLSLYNPDSLKYYSVADILILEDGKRWTIDTLINKTMSRKNDDIKRENAFRLIKTEQEGNIAWVSYYNAAVFSQGEKNQAVLWLESAVLEKANGRWKIRMLHSTKLK